MVFCLILKKFQNAAIDKTISFSGAFKDQRCIRRKLLHMIAVRDSIS